MTDRVRCSACAHEWIGVMPVGTNPCTLECPSCKALKGVLLKRIEHPVPTWHCTACGGWLFQLMNIKNVPCISCAECGEIRNAIDLFNGT